MASYVYILECSDSSYYVGSTGNLEQRLYEHNNGTYRGYTANRLPVKLLWSQEFPTILEAAKSERQIKGWSRAKKQALIQGNFQLLVELSRSKNSANLVTISE